MYSVCVTDAKAIQYVTMATFEGFVVGCLYVVAGLEPRRTHVAYIEFGACLWRSSGGW